MSSLLILCEPKVLAQFITVYIFVSIDEIHTSSKIDVKFVSLNESRLNLDRKGVTSWRISINLDFFNVVMK